MRSLFRSFERFGVDYLLSRSPDARFAVRLLVKSPTFALTAILTLELCIGLNTVVFSVVDVVLLRPLPLPQPERLAEVVLRVRAKGLEAENTAHTFGRE